MPLTPPPRPSSSFVFRASSCSAVMRAEAANWALAWSNVFATLCGHVTENSFNPSSQLESSMREGEETHLRAAGSLLVLLHLLLVHQGQLLLMLLVLVCCECWNTKSGHKPDFLSNSSLKCCFRRFCSGSTPTGCSSVQQQIKEHKVNLASQTFPSSKSNKRLEAEPHWDSWLSGF